MTECKKNCAKMAEVSLNHVHLCSNARVLVALWEEHEVWQTQVQVLVDQSLSFWGYYLTKLWLHSYLVVHLDRSNLPS